MSVSRSFRGILVDLLGKPEVAMSALTPFVSRMEQARWSAEDTDWLEGKFPETNDSAVESQSRSPEPMTIDIETWLVNQIRDIIDGSLHGRQQMMVSLESNRAFFNEILVRGYQQQKIPINQEADFLVAAAHARLRFLVAETPRYTADPTINCRELPPSEDSTVASVLREPTKLQHINDRIERVKTIGNFTFQMYLLQSETGRTDEELAALSGQSLGRVRRSLAAAQAALAV